MVLSAAALPDAALSECRAAGARRCPAQSRRVLAYRMRRCASPGRRMRGCQPWGRRRQGCPAQSRQAQSGQTRSQARDRRDARLPDAGLPGAGPSDAGPPISEPAARAAPHPSTTGRTRPPATPPRWCGRPRCALLRRCGLPRCGLPRCGPARSPPPVSRPTAGGLRRAAPVGWACSVRSAARGAGRRARCRCCRVLRRDVPDPPRRSPGPAPPGAGGQGSGAGHCGGHRPG